MTNRDFALFQRIFAAFGPGLVQNEVAKKFPVDAIWRNKDYDKPVTLTGMAGEKDGEIFYQLADGPGHPGIGA
jgi:hypothetical protein